MKDKTNLPGEELPRETWLCVADSLRFMAEHGVPFMRAIGGDMDAEEFALYMQLAAQAATYVAEFARDKCRVVVVPKGKEAQEANKLKRRK